VNVLITDRGTADFLASADLKRTKEKTA